MLTWRRQQRALEGAAEPRAAIRNAPVAFYSKLFDGFRFRSPRYWLAQQSRRIHEKSWVMTKHTTFRDLDGNAEPPGPGDSSLEQWYDSIRDTTLVSLSDADTSRACRQRLFPEFIVPIAIDRLRSNPLAGKKYPGELLVAVEHIPRAYWKNYVGQAGELVDVLKRIDIRECNQYAIGAIVQLEEKCKLDADRKE